MKVHPTAVALLGVPPISGGVNRLDVNIRGLQRTLRGFVVALGADLELVARFHDGHVVRIDLSDVA